MAPNVEGEKVPILTYKDSGSSDSGWLIGHGSGEPRPVPTPAQRATLDLMLLAPKFLLALNNLIFSPWAAALLTLCLNCQELGRSVRVRSRPS